MEVKRVYTAWLQLKISPGMKAALELMAKDIGSSRSEFVRFLIIEKCKQFGGQALGLLDVSDMLQVKDKD